MINLVGLVRHLREQFPVPEGYQAIYEEMCDWLKDEPSDEIQYDAYKALVAVWQRGDWVLDNEIGAVRLNAGEDAFFDTSENTITLTAVHGNSTMSFSLMRGEKHDRILWF
jgi:hypothetical protein